ncbi:hypothetical protein IM697_22195 [Streptomyces ferrugineus]|uniref:Regulatory protein n=1 Tax=Streptomyces ferrugineus TaxID=1413221 RepID=A0A7M2SWU9_9ACTN|nr:hypothetical protein [Streptomyces ferrugineus]QOV40857.1 hypothetical protein IM697_22195 [Streptomyces ferrugineus]
MPETTTTPTSELASQYITQVTDDLERNIKEQERIGAEIASLQEQLTALQHDHTVLVNMQQALGIAPAPAEPAVTPESAPVPPPRQKGGTRSPGKPTARKTAAQAAGTTKTARPTLVELIRRHLTEQSEPRSAAEVATALDQAHPERGIKTKVVRVTLEGLVAKSEAQRNKQGTSVFYTAPKPPAAAPSAGSQPESADH